MFGPYVTLPGSRGAHDLEACGDADDRAGTVRLLHVPRPVRRLHGHRRRACPRSANRVGARAAGRYDAGMKSSSRFVPLRCFAPRRRRLFVVRGTRQLPERGALKRLHVGALSIAVLDDWVANDAPRVVAEPVSWGAAGGSRRSVCSRGSRGSFAE